MAAAPEAGAEEVKPHRASFWEVVTEGHPTWPSPGPALAGAAASTTSRPTSSSSRRLKVEVDADTARKIFRLIDALEDSDDVQNVFSNFDLPPRCRRSSRPTTGRARLPIRRPLAHSAERGIPRLRVLGIDPGLTRCGVGSWMSRPTVQRRSSTWGSSAPPDVPIEAPRDDRPRNP